MHAYIAIPLPLPSYAIDHLPSDQIIRADGGREDQGVDKAFLLTAHTTHIRSLDKLSTFKRQLKSHLFQSAFAA